MQDLRILYLTRIITNTFNLVKIQTAHFSHSFFQFSLPANYLKHSQSTVFLPMGAVLLITTYRALFFHLCRQPSASWWWPSKGKCRTHINSSRSAINRSVVFSLPWYLVNWPVRSLALLCVVALACLLVADLGQRKSNYSSFQFSIDHTGRKQGSN